MPFQSNKQQFCKPYHNQRTDSDVEGCGKPVKWIEADTQWGKRNQKVNMDGSKHVCQGGVKMPGRTADMEPEEYTRLTGATVASQGLKEANANSFLKDYFDKNLTLVIKDALNQALDDHQTKTSSNNVSIATIGKNIDDLEKKIDQKLDQVLDKVDAVLAANSFQGADEMFHKATHSHNPAEGEVILAGEDDDNEPEI